MANKLISSLVKSLHFLWKKRRLIFGFSILFVLLILLSLFFSNRWVENSAKNKIFNSIDNIPANKVGMILGTSKYTAKGYINQYYKYRIDAAVELYKQGKISYILVSGDNGRKSYDEPTTIKSDLMARGVPEDRIYLDYAGFRTFDSVVRCKEIFGQDSVTIISQPFHNKRAIYIAERKGINAIGFNAKEVNAAYGFRTMVRERFARVKMVLDLLIDIQPKFLGKKIEIG